jgi:hypothetical protein
LGDLSLVNGLLFRERCPACRRWFGRPSTPIQSSLLAFLMFPLVFPLMFPGNDVDNLRLVTGAPFAEVEHE